MFSPPQNQHPWHAYCVDTSPQSPWGISIEVVFCEGFPQKVSSLPKALLPDPDGYWFLIVASKGAAMLIPAYPLGHAVGWCFVRKSPKKGVSFPKQYFLILMDTEFLCIPMSLCTAYPTSHVGKLEGCYVGTSPQRCALG